MKEKFIDIALIDENEGQIEGVARNPREWSKADVERLAKSIEETPELLEARGLIVVEREGRYVVLGGNLRLAALRHLKRVEAPCVVIPSNTDTKTLREIVIKDNGSFGSWDFEALEDDWNDLPLSDWGIEIEDSEGEGEVIKSEEINVVRIVEVHVDSEADQSAIYNELTERGFVCKVLTL